MLNIKSNKCCQNSMSGIISQRVSTYKSLRRKKTSAVDRSYIENEVRM